MLYFLAFLLEVLDCGPKCRQHRNEYAKTQQYRREYDIQQRNMIAKTNLIAWVVPHFVRTILDLLHVKCSKL